jgi:glycosyltransferase involved in cell wall biosynthesis
MMRLCLIMGGAEEGGLENHVLTLCNRFVGQFEIYLIAHPKYRDRLDARVNLIPMPMDLGRRNPWLLIRLFLALRKLKPDLIHSHGNKATAILASLKPWLRCPCIATVHSVKRRVEMFEEMDAVIGVSAGVLKGIEHARKKVIYNGVDEYHGTVISREQLLNHWGLAQDKKLCVAVGRLVPVKAYDLLIKAWNEVDHNLVIIGEGPESKRLQKLIDDLGLDDRIRLAGFRPDIRAILPSVDLLAISSEREGFSLVLIEALLAETPVVSTMVAGSIEILPQDYLSPVHEVESYRVVISAALRDGDKLGEAYKPVFEMARSCLTTTAMLEQTQNFYHQLREETH